MKKFYKFATLLIALCFCFIVVGCFGDTNGTMSKNYSEAKKEGMNSVNASNDKQVTNKDTNNFSYDDLPESLKQKAKENTMRFDCKSNLINIATACEMYAADHQGRYPKNLDELTKFLDECQKGKHQNLSQTNNDFFNEFLEEFNKNGSIKLPTCPANNEQYIYISKEKPDYFILKCNSSKHKLMFDSEFGRIDLDTGDENTIIEHYKEIMTGSIDTKYGTVKLTPEELKELEFK